MGGVQSTTCKQRLNPDLLTAVTLSDSAVQRLPLENDNSPLDREQRNQNIDDFWRDRLECVDQTFLESRQITEKEFYRLEFAIKNNTNVTSGKPLCLRGIDDTKTCYLTYPNETLNCRRTVEKLQLCLNTMMQDASKKKFDERLKDTKKLC